MGWSNPYNHYDFEGWWMPKPIGGSQTPALDPIFGDILSGPNQDPEYGKSKAQFQHPTVPGKGTDTVDHTGWGGVGYKRPGDYVDNPKAGKVGRPDDPINDFNNAMDVLSEAARYASTK